MIKNLLLYSLTHNICYYIIVVEHDSKFRLKQIVLNYNNYKNSKNILFKLKFEFYSVMR